MDTEVFQIIEGKTVQMSRAQQAFLSRDSLPRAQGSSNQRHSPTF